MESKQRGESDDNDQPGPRERRADFLRERGLPDDAGFYHPGSKDADKPPVTEDHGPAPDEPEHGDVQERVEPDTDEREPTE